MLTDKMSEYTTMMTNSGNMVTTSFDESAWAQAAEPQRSTTIAALASGWKNPKLTPLGMFYPLGPCRTTFDKSRLDCVLQTLPELFRVLSLEALYEDAPLVATCRSLDEVEFVLSMFEGKDNQVILELQRYSGDTIVYHQYARQILRSVNTGKCSTMKPSFNKRRVPMTATLTTAAQQQEIVVEAVERAYEMLATERYDSQQLALESLLHMTNPNTSGWATAKAVTEILLSPTDYIQGSLSTRLAAFACQDEPKEAYRATSTHLALAVMAQIFLIAAKAELSVRGFLRRCPTGFVDCIHNKLHQGAHDHHPCPAYHAARCLTAICMTVPELRSQIIKSNKNYAEEAAHYGESHHLALANASHKLLVALQ